MASKSNHTRRIHRARFFLNSFRESLEKFVTKDLHLPGLSSDDGNDDLVLSETWGLRTGEGSIFEREGGSPKNI